MKLTVTGHNLKYLQRMELATKLMTSLSGNSIKNEALPSPATAPIQVSVSDMNSLPPSSPLEGGTNSDENSEPIANVEEEYTPASSIESQSVSPPFITPSLPFVNFPFVPRRPTEV
jgi:hypothetical protein